MDKFLENLVSDLEHSARLGSFLDEFASVDAVKIAGLSDLELAAWQCKYPPESPQWLLASFEWQRRLTVKQIRAVRFTAWLTGIFSLVSGLTGVILGWWLKGAQ